MVGDNFRVLWQVLHVLKWLLLIIVIIPLINYASLKKEESVLLPPDALLYDIGSAQKLMLRCSGRGSPTVILDSPTGNALVIKNLFIFLLFDE